MNYQTGIATIGVIMTVYGMYTLWKLCKEMKQK